MSFILTVLQSAVVCVVTWVLWRYFRYYIARSPLDNIPGPPPQSFFMGNYSQLFNLLGWKFQDELTENYASVVKLTGFFGARMLYVFDPKALHNIIVKEQYVYEEPEYFIHSMKTTLGPGLLATLGDHHRKQRKLLNPVFSIAHMRHMLPIFYEITHKLRMAIEAQVKDGPKEMDMLNWMGRTALELVGQGGLGYSFDPLTEDIHTELGDAIKAFAPALANISTLRRALPYVNSITTPAFRRFILHLIPLRRVQHLKSIVDKMQHDMTDIFHSKKTALEQGDEAVVAQVGEGKDIMSTLLKANLQASDEDKLSDEELIGQMTTLVFAAMDTTSSALSHIVQLLAQHPDAQEKLRKEIIEARDSGRDISYDELVALPYLDAVCRETLRLHPPVSFLFRETHKDAVMPLSEPIVGLNGALITEIPVPKNTSVIVGILASNRNKAIWGSDALEWKPERWLSPLPQKVTDAHIPGVYSNLMTFLGGGRACIGFKFSQLEMKVVLSLLIGSFKFSLPDEPIVWKMAGVKFPSIGKDDMKAQMPMKVEIWKST